MNGARIAAAEEGVRLAEERARRALADLDAATLRLERVRDEPSEPKRRSVIQFQVRYHKGETDYTYVAYRAPDGFWYRTGTANKLTWDQLLGFMLRDVVAAERGVGFFLYRGKSAKWVGRAEK